MKKVLIILSVVAILVLAFFFFYRGRLVINAVSKGTDIRVDKKTYKNVDSLDIKIFPGKHKITVSKDGYEDVTKEVEIKLQKTSALDVVLSPALVILSESASFPELSDDKNHVYFLDKNTAKLSRIELKNKKKEELSDSFSSEVESLYWSPDKSGAIVFLLEKNRPRANFYDIKSRGLTPLDKNIGEPVTWSPDSSKIAYPYFNISGSYSLNISQPNGESWRSITNILTPQVIQWSVKNQILFVPLGVESVEPSYLINPGSGDKGEVSRKNIIRANFLPAGDKIIYEALNEDGSNSLEILNINDGSTKTIEIKSQLNKLVVDPDGGRLYYLSSEGFVLESAALVQEFLGIIDLNSLKETKKVVLSKQTYGANLILTNDNKIIFLSDNVLYSYIYEN